MQLSDSEKLEMERTGRTTGRFTVVCHFMSVGMAAGIQLAAARIGQYQRRAQPIPELGDAAFLRRPCPALHVTVSTSVRSMMTS